MHAHTDGSLDKATTNRSSGMFLTTPNETTYQCMIRVVNTASNFTCELQVLFTCTKLPPSEQVNGLVIFYDSRSALQAVSNGNSFVTNKIIFFLQDIEKLNYTCFF